jgi:Spy/CpxP family protein refolding chaperone
MPSPLFGALVALAMLLAGAASAPAQHQGHTHTHGAPSDGHLRAQACIDELEAVVRDGRGFGMAFVADQQGYPGPLHVLELKDRLRLDATQETRVRALLQAMYDEARPKGARLLEAEASLRRLFGAGAADPSAVRTAVAEVEQARTELRLVHLLAHLQTRALLTDAQRRAYHEARWPGR